MIQVVFVGIAAGLAAALLFLAPASGSPLAFPLFALTGLPIAIAGLAWGFVGGAIAAVAGGVVIAVVLASAIPALIFFGLFGAPIVWLTRLAGMWRATGVDDKPGGREWYPLERLLLHATLVVAVCLSLVGFVSGYDPEVIARAAMMALGEFLAEMQSSTPPPSVEALAPVIRIYVLLLPFTTAMFIVAVTVLDLWLAALVARASGRLARPQGRLWTVTLPNEILIGFAVAALLSFLPGVLGDVALVFAGAFGCALALVGLAVLHALTLGVVGRGAILGVTYALIVLSGLPLLFFAILGAGESFLHLRARRFGGAPPPS